jgi:hypothetical protein
MQVTTVTSEPLSGDDNAAIGRLPFGDTTLHAALLIGRSLHRYADDVKIRVTVPFQARAQRYRRT